MVSLPLKERLPVGRIPLPWRMNLHANCWKGKDMARKINEYGETLFFVDVDPPVKLLSVTPDGDVFVYNKDGSGMEVDSAALFELLSQHHPRKPQ